jgi:uncharacterized protein
MDFLWTAALMGLGGSLHCVLMCGPLAGSIPGSARSGASPIVNKLIYHGGRISSYLAIGFLFGLIGEAVSLVIYQQYISLLAGAALLLYLALRFFIPKAALNQRLLRRWNDGLNNIFALLRQEHGLLPVFGFGIVNGFLPCGLVYLAAAASLQGGDWVYSQLYMLLFGLGTLPAMFGISFLSTKLKMQRFIAKPRFTIVAVLVLGSLFLVRGMALGIPYLSPNISSPTETSCCHASNGSCH